MLMRRRPCACFHPDNYIDQNWTIKSVILTSPVRGSGQSGFRFPCINWISMTGSQISSITNYSQAGVQPVPAADGLGAVRRKANQEPRIADENHALDETHGRRRGGAGGR